MASTQAVLLEKLLEAKAQSQNVAASISALKLQTDQLDAQLGELIDELKTSQNSKPVPINLMPETKNVVSNSPVLVPVVKLNRVQSKDSTSLILQSNHKKLAAKGKFLIIHFWLSKKHFILKVLNFDTSFKYFIQF